ncbi:MAG: glycosyltransferase, partial [candidate division KSB1 bacterium]|nr:glycosyltransferase [candidate division KSB1 bacterium]
RQAAEYIKHLPLHRKVRRMIGNMKRFVQRRLRVKPSWYPLPAEVCGSILSDEEMVRIPSQSHISLNFSEVKDELNGEIKRHIRLRDFEVPMSGGLLMTGYQDELMEYYEIGREILCYDSKEELLDKCRYYLRHQQEAEAIRQAGYERARRDHTWANRFQQLFQYMGIHPPLSPRHPGRP